MFGQKIKDARLGKGLSQTALAHLTDLPQCHVSDIERGKVTVAHMRLITFCKLCDALDMDAQEFLGDLQEAGELANTIA